jgi:acetylornithine deacetylase/succinyl-diaminopimelate desuccinylase-like protein
LIPIIIDPAELKRMHGIDERISVENLALGL